MMVDFGGSSDATNIVSKKINNEISKNLYKTGLNIFIKNTFKDYGKKKNPKVAYKKRTALKSDLYRDFDKKSKEMKGNDKAKGKKENKGNKNKSKHANNGR